MPLVTEVQAMLEQVAAAGGVPIDQLTPEQARATYQAFATLAAEVVEVGSVRDIPVEHDVRLRVYTPSGERETARPALLWVHGGGFVIGDLETADPTARALASLTGAVVVSVDYRRAPEHRCPTAALDCMAALEWVVSNASDLGIDPARVAVGGDSAGGNLAAVVSRLARDRGGPAIVLQVLVYPCLDAAMDTASHRENAEGFLLTGTTMRWFWASYLGSEVDPRDPMASPLHAADLSRLPPALIITAEFDPLRDEGEAYGAALAAAGVPVTVSRYDGEVHGFFVTSPIYGPPSSEAFSEVAAALQTAFTA